MLFPVGLVSVTALAALGVASEPINALGGSGPINAFDGSDPINARVRRFDCEPVGDGANCDAKVFAKGELLSMTVLELLVNEAWC